MTAVLTLGAHMASVRQRIAVGLELLDVAGERGVDVPLEVRLLRVGSTWVDLPLDDHGGGHFALRYAGRFQAVWDAKVKASPAPGNRVLDLRVCEPRRPGPRGAPAAHANAVIGRRFQLALAEADVPAGDRRPAATQANVFKVRLWRGPAASIPAGLTILRGRCIYAAPRAEEPVRYARVFATTPPANGDPLTAVVRGSAICDARGDYVMVVGGGLLAPAATSTLTRVRLWAFGRPNPNPPVGLEFEPESPQRSDFWDLPVELQVAALAPAADALKRLPATFTHSVTAPTPDHTVQIRVGQAHSGPNFDLTFPVLP